MLRLYKNTIICSALALGICIAVSILCERFTIPHSGLIQNFSIGTTCSLLVVVITTVLQYRYEHDRGLSNYYSLFRRLCFHLSLVCEDLSDSEIDTMRKWLDNDIRAFEKSNKVLTWFSLRKKRQQAKVNHEFSYIFLAFEKQRFEQHKCLIEQLCGNEHIARMIDLAILFFTNEFDIKALEESKRSIIEARDSTNGRRHEN